MKRELENYMLNVAARMKATVNFTYVHRNDVVYSDYRPPTTSGVRRTTYVVRVCSSNTR